MAPALHDTAVTRRSARWSWWLPGPSRNGDRVRPHVGAPRRGRGAHRAGAGLLLTACVAAVLAPGTAQAESDGGLPSRDSASSPWSVALPPGVDESSRSTSSPAEPDDENAPGGRVLRVAPDGDGDGSSWSDAAGLADLSDLVDELSEDGGQVWLRADDGPYQVRRSIRIRAGAGAGERVVVRGVDEDGNPRKAEIRSNRAESWGPGDRKGSEVFKLGDGADRLTFRDLKLVNTGAVFTVTRPIDDLEVRQVDADNVRYFVTNQADGRSGDASIRGLRISDVKVRGYSKSVVMLRYKTKDVLLEDVHGDSEGQQGDPFAMGVSLKGRVSGVTIRRVSMANNVSKRGDYWNGDGFATERKVRSVLFEDTSASGNTDAGYDLKSRDTRLVDAKASENKRNFRFWSPETISCLRCVGEDPDKAGGSGSAAQVWLAKDARAELKDSRLLGSGDLVVEASDDAQLDITGGRITHDGDGELARTDPGADVDLDDVDTPDNNQAEDEDD